MAKFDIIEVYQRVFSYKGLPFIGLDTKGRVPDAPEKSSIETVEEPGVDTGFSRDTSFLGKPLFMPCKLDDVQLPNEPTIEVRGGKTIIKTLVDGNEGTFKEKFNLSDYVVTIRGVAVREDNSDEYPEELVRQLRGLCEKPTHVSATCKLLGIFNIKHLAIEDHRFPAVEGAPGMQPYELMCLSDKFFDLELLEGTV